ncbi:MAG: aminotransferase class I/II-fold pyridoxal phosphate-dependent enzyme [Lentisphaeria bacterium]|nr:aminotransferase class I/II-fold pyridoxal phosphate-dependent enzyme [Lentisphaeria bacterium]
MAATNPQAQALNDTIEASHPQVLDMLSTRGKNIFFPAKGILGQTAEAKGKRINATIGTALEDDGGPLFLQCVKDLIDVPAGDAFMYAPSYGRPDLRAKWKEMIIEKNSGIQGDKIGTPVVACALTHSLSMCGYLFLDEGEEILMPDLYWGNYKLIFEQAYNAKIATFNTFKSGSFDLESLGAAIDAGGEKVTLLLNFPNNPTGYTVTEKEAIALKALLLEKAEQGKKLVVLTDDAYFGLVFEEQIILHSIFQDIYDLHENILAVKIDGATKEDYVWGFRVGFITYGVKGGSDALYKALEAKTAGAIRGNISNGPNLSQTICLKAFQHPEYAEQKKEKYEVLKNRFDKVKEVLSSHPEYKESFEAVPFNSGYFMCVKLNGADPEEVRQILLSDFDTGLIAAAGLLRVAFAAAPYSVIEELFENIHQAVQKVKAS